METASQDPGHGHLSEFGCTGDNVRDITGDGAVTANDILALLASRGALAE